MNINKIIEIIENEIDWYNAPIQWSYEDNLKARELNIKMQGAIEALSKILVRIELERDDQENTTDKTDNPS